jgi:hypothetical protein
MFSREGSAVTTWRSIADATSKTPAGRPVNEATLQPVLEALGYRISPHQLTILLRQLGVISPSGFLVAARADALATSLDLVGDSFAFYTEKDTWRPVATIPEAYWRGDRIPTVRQTAGTVLQIIESSRRTLRIAAPYVDHAAVELIRQPVLQCGRRRVCIRITTSPGYGLQFQQLVDGWPGGATGSITVVEVDTTISPLGSHAKVITADGERAYIGSANLTAAGLGRQFELGADVLGSGVAVLDAVLQSVDELGSVLYEVKSPRSDRG